jgi:succinate dehydrogenase/fumarate reductase flavoprotein subunit
MATTSAYDLIVVGSGFAGCMTVLNFLETCKKEGTTGRVALVESGKKGERCGASRWTMAYLRLDKDLNFDEDWIKEMDLVSKGLTDFDYCRKLGQEARTTAEYVQSKGVKFNHYDEKNVSSCFYAKGYARRVI